MPRKKKDPTAEVVATDPYEGLSDDGHNDFMAQLIEAGVSLQERKDALQKEIADNREASRLIARTGLLSEKQAKAVELLYPLREKKATEEAATEVPAVTPADAVTPTDNGAPAAA